MHAMLTQNNKMFDPHLLVVTRARASISPIATPGFITSSRCLTVNVLTWDYMKRAPPHSAFRSGRHLVIFCNIHPEMSAVVVVLPSHICRHQ